MQQMPMYGSAAPQCSHDCTSPDIYKTDLISQRKKNDGTFLTAETEVSVLHVYVHSR